MTNTTEQEEPAMTVTEAAPAQPYDDEATDEGEPHVERIATPDAEPTPPPELGVRPSHHGARLIAGTDLPVIPVQGEMQGLAQLALTLAAADVVPKALRNKPNDVYAVLLTARDLGVATTTALREFHVIEGKVTLSPKVKLSMIRQQGLGRVWPDEGNDGTTATWYGERTDMPGITVSSTWTWADAERVDSGKLTRKDNWRNYPARMLSWRALGYLIDDLFGEVATGLYSPDELGAVTDDDGQVVIDVVAHAEPLPGMKAPRGHGQAAAPVELINEGDVKHLRDRIAALPDAGIDEARKLWVGDDPENPRLQPLTRLPANQYGKAKALIDSIEARAKRGEWGAWAPAGEPQGDPGPDTAGDGQEATSSDEAVQSEPDGPTVEQVDYAIEVVKALEWPAVCEELAARSMPNSGARNQRRAELAMALAVEAHEATQDADAPADA